jgi:hypothetical protein
MWWVIARLQLGECRPSPEPVEGGVCTTSARRRSGDEAQSSAATSDPQLRYAEERACPCNTRASLRARSTHDRRYLIAAVSNTVSGEIPPTRVRIPPPPFLSQAAELKARRHSVPASNRVAWACQIARAHQHGYVDQGRAPEPPRARVAPAQPMSWYGAQDGARSSPAIADQTRAQLSRLRECGTRYVEGTDPQHVSFGG